MKRKNTYIVIAPFFIIAMIFLSILSQSGKQIHIILNSLPEIERSNLERLCRYLIQKTDLGYTVFCDKPMSYVTFSVPELARGAFEKSILYFGMPILKKVLHQLTLGDFIFSECTKKHLQIFYLVNKKAAKQTILQNRSEFAFYDAHVNEEQLIPTVLNEKCLSELFYRGNCYLLGILSGYGKQNAYHIFRCELLKEHLNRAFDRPLCLGDLFSFLGMIDELKHLKRKLCRTSECYPENDSLVRLPRFTCDPESKETIVLIEKYQKQQQVLEQVLSQDNATKQVLEKLTGRNL